MGRLVPKADREGSSSGSTGEPEDLRGEGSEVSAAVVCGQQGSTGKTKAELLKLMEETSEEMRRARSLLLGYQEASREVISSPRSSIRAVQAHGGSSEALASTSTVPVASATAALSCA